MMKIANHTALKEWASVIAALKKGDQVVLVRKGGIADARFGVESERFYLLPTYLHQREKQFRAEFRHYFEETDQGEAEPAEVVIDAWAEVASVHRIADPACLRGLASHVIFSDATISERFRFRSDQAVHVIGVRVYNLANPVRVLNRQEYAGCRSWVSLTEEISIDGSTPALSDEDFARRLSHLHESLAIGVSAT